MLTDLENKIKLLLLKAKIDKSFKELELFSILEKIKKKAGSNYVPSDPYGEENWGE